MCTKSSKKQNLVISEERTNEEVVYQRYVEPLEPFLAIILTERCGSQIQGLKYKYPAAFAQWDALPYQKARAFAWGTFEQEYTSRMAYAVLQYAHQDEMLQSELRSLIKKEFKDVDEYCTLRNSPESVTDEEALFLVRKVIKSEDLGCPRSMVNAYSVVDYFIHQYGLTYEVDEPFKQTLGFLKRSIRFLLLDYSIKGFNTSMIPVEDKMMKRVKTEVRAYVKACEVKIGMDLVNYCRQLSTQAYWSRGDHPYQADIYRQFCQDIRSLIKSYPITNTDIEQLIYTLLEKERHKQPSEARLGVEEFSDYMVENLIPAVLNYIHAKAMAMDRQYVRKMQANSDAQLYQAMQKEMVQLRDDLTRYKSMADSVQEKVQQTKEVCQKQSAQEIKQLKSAVIISEQKIRKCEKELEEKNEEIEALKKELEEIKTIESEWDDFEKDHSEEEDRWIKELNRPDVLIVGCHPRTIHRLKRLLPDVKYYELDTNIQDHYLMGVEHIFICLHQVNHAMIYKLDRCCAQVPRYPIRKTNPHLILQGLAQTLKIA